MQTNLVDIARSRRLTALASLPSNASNVTSLRSHRAQRQMTAAAIPFVSVRTPATPIYLAA